MDYITIKNLEAFSRQNAFDGINKPGQKYAIDMRLFLDTRKASMSDDIDKSVDYAGVCKFINAFIKGHSYKLIETAAERLAEDVLIEYPILSKVELTVKKPWAPVGLPIEEVAVTIERAWHNVYLSLGSNMGDREEYLNRAKNYLAGNDKVVILKEAGIIETLPYGMEKQDKFLNSAIQIRTLLDPVELLVFCKNIEKMCGRVKTEHWGPRPLDIDILFYDDEIIYSEDLTVPHADMKNRTFVLGPMCEIAPFFRHPIYNKSIREMYEELISKQDNYMA